MKQTLDWLHRAEREIRLALEGVRPKLLEAQGNIEHHIKDDKSVVTEMDVPVEHTLKEHLQKFDGGIPFSGEETGTDYEQETHWLVDPIDSTESFIRGMPFASNMVTLIDGGEPILAVIYQLSLGDYYMAIKGQGATRNGHPIHVSNRPLNRAFLMVSGNPSKDRRTFALIDRLRTELGAANGLKTAASGFQNPTVALGAVEGHVVFYSNASPWDNAPGALLIQEAGGRVANIGSDTYDYRDTNFIGTNPVIFDDVMRFMTKLAAEKH